VKEALRELLRYAANVVAYTAYAAASFFAWCGDIPHRNAAGGVFAGILFAIVISHFIYGPEK
jgi:hypothetical protein